MWSTLLFHLCVSCFIFIHSTLEINVDLGLLSLCSGKTLSCQCGNPGYIVQIPIKQCVFLQKLKPYCRPCDVSSGGSEEQICAKYKNCLHCKSDLQSCAACPPNKYGVWCTGNCDCRNGGMCSTFDGKCTCRHGFKGTKCEERIGCAPPPVSPPLLESRVPTATPFYIEYSCADGHKMIGLSRITCLPNHQWSGPPPKCARICQLPVAPPNGKVHWRAEDNEIVEGHEIEFSCDNEHALIGQKKLTCRANGSWSHEIPICEKLILCKDPGVILFGNRQIHSVPNLDHPFVAGTRVIYNCTSKFLLLGPTVLTCGADGAWSSPPPSCIKVSHIQSDCQTKGTEVIDEIGVPVRLECPPECSEISNDVWGTVIYEESSAVCTAAIHAGRITNAGGSVYVVKNGPYSFFIASDMNGIVSKGRQDLSESFRFHYNPDWNIYEISHAEDKKCPEGWIAIEEKLCAFIVPQPLAWEVASGLCSNLGASVALALQDEPLRLDNLTKALHDKGIPNAWIDVTILNTTSNNGSEESVDDDLCPFLTLDEEESHDRRLSRTSCLKNFPVVCLGSLVEKKVCKDLGPLTNGFANLHGRQEEHGFLVGSITTYSCATLHFLRGSANVTCLSNLTWSGQKPECVRVTTCPEPVSILYGYVETLPPSKSEVLRRKAVILPRFNATKQHRKVDVQQFLRNPQNYVHVETGKMSSPYNVTIPEGYHPVGSRAVYSCQSRYYQLIGSQTRRCQNDGNWSGRTATCIAICGRSDSPRTPFITHGNATEVGQWPWQIAISQWLVDYSLWFMICGGALLNERWVITAAHCVTYSGSNIIVPSMELRVHLGKYYRSSDKDDEYVQMRQVKEIHIHHDYDPNQYDADIALIELKEPAVLTSRVQPVCLPTTTTTRKNIVNGKFGVVTGWGLTENATYGESLREAVIPVVSEEKCQKSYEDVKVLLTVTENMYCAGYDNSTIDTCSGDSGGPMVFADDSGSERRWVLEGIISWGSPNGCGKPNQFGGYTTVSRFLNWINEFI